MLGRDGGGLEALAVVAALLDMADRRAEERGAVLLRDGEQRDLAVEGDELLDDEFADVAAAAAAPVFPGVFQFVGVRTSDCPLPEEDISGLTTHGKPIRSAAAFSSSNDLA